MTKTLSPESRDLLERRLARKMTPGLKVTITVENLGVLLDAARVEGHAAAAEYVIAALTAASDVLDEHNKMTDKAAAMAAGARVH